MNKILKKYYDAGARTPAQVLSLAATRGKAALREASRALAVEVAGKLNNSALIILPAEPPGKQVCAFIRKLVPLYSRIIVVPLQAQGRLAPGSFDKLLRASMPDAETKIKVMDSSGSVSDIIHQAEANGLYIKSHVLQVFCDEQMARNFAQQIRDGEFKLDPTTISLNPGDIPSDDFDAIEKAVSKRDLAAMHRVLDPHVFSSPTGVIDYRMAATPQNEALGKSGVGSWEFEKQTTSAANSTYDGRIFHDLMKKFADKLLKRGIDVSGAQDIGQGTQGIAYKLSNGKVLKLTNDEDEAKASSLIMKHPSEHLVRIFDVFMFPEEYNNRVFGITKELLQQLSPEEKQIAIKVRMSNEPLPEDSKELSIPEMRAELEAAGIRNFCDYSENNIMKRGDTYVLVDPGYSDPIGGETPVLEKSLAKESFMREFLTDIASSRELAIKMIHDIVASNIDTSELQYLGSGRNGSAYRMPDGLILKITTDQVEVDSAETLLGQQCEYLYNIHRVFPIQEGLWAIVQEGELEKLPESLAESFDFAMEIVKVLGVAENLQHGDIASVVEAAEFGDPELCEFLGEVLVNFNIPEMCCELSNLGLTADFHSGNIMLRNGSPVLVDLGTPGKAPAKCGINELSGVQAAPQAGPGSGMRASNSSAWSGGRLVLKNPVDYVPKDENEKEIVGGGLDWGFGRTSGASQ